jgi:hypothetical protein
MLQHPRRLTNFHINLVANLETFSKLRKSSMTACSPSLAYQSTILLYQ